MSASTAPNAAKPLGTKAYGHIAHLPGSRMGPGDHKCHEGQARIATEKARDRHDRIYVQEKLDGSCVAVAKINGELVPLGRAGYRAITSPFQMHHMFHDWAMSHVRRFDDLLDDGERAVGEWLAQAHGTRYEIRERGLEPFVLFDVMRAGVREPTERFYDRARDFRLPYLLNGSDAAPMSIPDALTMLGTFGHYGATEPVEGAVWRVERKGVVDFLAKYVRPDKVDGAYLDSVTGGEPIWNWQS